MSCVGGLQPVQIIQNSRHILDGRISLTSGQIYACSFIENEGFSDCISCLAWCVDHILQLSVYSRAFWIRFSYRIWQCILFRSYISFIVSYPVVYLLQGIHVQVVELLIRKLENETSFHRKVDLFFLVDSITQCSHNQKGERIYFI